MNSKTSSRHDPAEKIGAALLLQRLLWAAIALQLIFGVVMVEEYMLYHSHFRAFMNRTMTRSQKLDAVLGGDYPVHIEFSSIPEDAGILAVATDPIYFCNYYFLPRRIYTYPGLTRDEDMHVPKAWLKERNITLMFSYHIPLFKVLQLNREGNIK